NQQEIFAFADAEKLDVVVYNLLSNAIKFTPEGKAITVAINALPGGEYFSIAIQDQGPGVPKEQLEEIFELFREIEHPAGRELKGTGIGLALSREFVRLHKGTIRAENNSDGGLTMTVELRLGAAHFENQQIAAVVDPPIATIPDEPIGQQMHSLSTNPQAPLISPPHGASMSPAEAPLVLLVEDNDELRSFIEGQLNKHYRVVTAGDGEEGLQKANDLAPDLIVSDIMMPKMDGIQLLDRIKNDENTSHIPVVLLSAKYSIESQIEGLRYGADYYITKPFNNEFLIASINNLIHQRKKLFEALVGKA